MRFNLDKRMVLVAIFVASYIFAPVLSGGRDISLFGFPLMAGTLLIYLNICLLSVIQQNYGRSSAESLVVAGIVAKVFVWICVLLTFLLPTARETAGYRQIVFGGFRVMAGDVITRYLGLVLIGIPLFQHLKDRAHSFWSCLAFSFCAEVVAYNSLMLVIAKWGTPGSLVDRIIAQCAFATAFLLVAAPLTSRLNRALFREVGV